MIGRRQFVIGVCLICIGLTSAGCATYWRDRARDFHDIYSVKAGRMTGIRVQAGPVEAAVIGERLPAPLYQPLPESGH